jgi:hypothetical protein
MLMLCRALLVYQLPAGLLSQYQLIYQLQSHQLAILCCSDQPLLNCPLQYPRLAPHHVLHHQLAILCCAEILLTYQLQYRLLNHRRRGASWITTQSVGALSAVCYIALRNVKLEATPNRSVGILASYVGGTPVACWANDPDADATCNVIPGTPGANVPCNPATACCPQKLYNEKINPLLPFRIRSALWYQGLRFSHNYSS